MKMMVGIGAVLSTLLVIGVSSVAFAVHSVPFRGTMSGTGVAISQNSNSITANALLSGLGKTTLAGVTTVTGLSECGGFVGTEQDTLTAANDDQIRILGNGHSCIGSAPNVFLDTVSFIITGGTGRFADATGSGTIHTTVVVISTAASTFTATIDGTVSL